MLEATIRTWARRLAAGMACGVLGWSAAQSGSSAAGQAVTTASPRVQAPRDITPRIPESIIAVADGKVTLHVDGQPLDAVLAEIDRQSGGASSRPRASTASVATCEPAPAQFEVVATAAHAAEVANRVMNGSEPQRYQTLIDAQNTGVVSEAMLKTLYQTDASPRVRLLAFDYSLEGVEGDSAAKRSVLEAARYLPDPVVAQEAARQLESMPDPERIANDPQLAAVRR